MEVSRKQIYDQFGKHVFENYRCYCKKHGLEESLDGLIAYLVDFEIIPTKIIHNYTIIQEYRNLLPKVKYQKTKTVIAIANRFNLSERSVWTILKKVKRSES